MSPRRRDNTYRPVETVFLPGDEELFGEFIRKGKFNRHVPHDHLEYQMRRNREYEEVERHRIREALRKLNKYLDSLEEK